MGRIKLVELCEDYYNKGREIAEQIERSNNENQR